MCIVKRPFVVGNNNNLTKNLSLDFAILVWTRGLAREVVGRIDSRNFQKKWKCLEMFRNVLESVGMSSSSGRWREVFRKAEPAAASDTTIEKCFRNVKKVLERFSNV